MMNAFINTKTNMKKLQYGTSKCFKMHVGRTCSSEICPDIFIDGWQVKEVEEMDTRSLPPEDEYSGMHLMKSANQEKYLGDIISKDGKNTKNVAARKNRGTGIIIQIQSILEDICFGKYHFEVAMILRNSFLLGSLLTNAEAWYNLSTSNITKLEYVDADLQIILALLGT